MEEFRFLNWNIYKDTRKFIKEIFILTSTLSFYHRQSIGTQLDRSALSMLLNIAEGSGKNSDKELNRFFNIAIGSAYETIANLDISHEIGAIDDDQFEKLSEMCKKIARQIGSFKSKLKR